MAKTTQVLKNFYRQIIGYIETDTRTGDKTGFDFYRRIVGYYDKRRNVTTDFYRRVVANGDILASLITEADRSNNAKK